MACAICYVSMKPPYPCIALGLAGHSLSAAQCAAARDADGAVAALPAGYYGARESRELIAAGIDTIPGSSWYRYR